MTTWICKEYQVTLRGVAASQFCGKRVAAARQAGKYGGLKQVVFARCLACRRGRAMRDSSQCSLSPSQRGGRRSAETRRGIRKKNRCSVNEAG